MLLLRQILPIDLISLMLPTSLLICMKLTSKVFLLMVFSNSLISIEPLAFGDNNNNSKPSFSNCLHGSITDLCSAKEEIICCLESVALNLDKPNIAKLFASVAPDVQTISSGKALMNEATSSLAFSISSYACLPNK